MELKDFKDLSEIKKFVESLDGLTIEDKENLFKSMTEDFIHNAMAVKSPEFAALTERLKAQRSFLLFTRGTTNIIDDYMRNFKYLINNFLEHNKLDWNVELKIMAKYKIGVYVNNILGCEIDV